MRQKLLAYGLLFATLMPAVLPQLALADPYGGGPGYSMTLEQDLELAKERVQIAKEHPEQGSGTPYLSANGVVGATLISGAVFGGIFVTFVSRAKQLEKLHKIRAVP
jgi:hypothetical protein